MKRIYLLIMLAFLALLSACSNNNINNVNATTDTISIEGANSSQNKEVQKILDDSKILIKSYKKYVPENVGNSDIEKTLLNDFQSYIIVASNDTKYTLIIKNVDKTVQAITGAEGEFIYGDLAFLADSVNIGNKSKANNKDMSVKDKLTQVEDFLRKDIWNDGFCEITWFTYRGTGALNNTLDIDFLINELGKSMETKREYDDFINNLDNEKYSDIKSIWEKVSLEINNLYNKLKENPPVAKDESYDFDVGLYKQYSDAFKKAISKIED